MCLYLLVSFFLLRVIGLPGRPGHKGNARGRRLRARYADDLAVPRGPKQRRKQVPIEENHGLGVIVLRVLPIYSHIYIYTHPCICVCMYVMQCNVM